MHLLFAFSAAFGQILSELFVRYFESSRRLFNLLGGFEFDRAEIAERTRCSFVPGAHTWLFRPSLRVCLEPWTNGEDSSPYSPRLLPV